MKFIYLLLLLLLLLPLTSCLDDEMAFTVEASPLKAEIVRLDDAPDGTVSYRATFTELDKEGILDANVGIISTPAAGLELTVYSQTQTALETVITDDAGQVVFSAPTATLQGVSRLEWAGTYQGKAFRLLTNL
ncbi:hypothetical protein GGR26_003239 [Lewinella marina]|uniref:Uncharacterized protein n=1 Tax=Neolewinella marina TaxID=438751 RepID=A0A2G0CE31_9BACT|nr:hypothetical protein [Neolewinella marina]NJB87459.1 hypothetical protein [Neolewinella marina]PHK98233.1 hypothetical protein CGL56_11045 [Neolewinella marina]